MESLDKMKERLVKGEMNNPLKFWKVKADSGVEDESEYRSGDIMRNGMHFNQYEIDIGEDYVLFTVVPESENGTTKRTVIPIKDFIGCSQDEEDPMKIQINFFPLVTRNGYGCRRRAGTIRELSTYNFCTSST